MTRLKTRTKAAQSGKAAKSTKSKKVRKDNYWETADDSIPSRLEDWVRKALLKNRFKPMKGDYFENLGDQRALFMNVNIALGRSLDVAFQYAVERGYSAEETLLAIARMLLYYASMFSEVDFGRKCREYTITCEDETREAKKYMREIRARIARLNKATQKGQAK